MATLNDKWVKGLAAQFKNALAVLIGLCLVGIGFVMVEVYFRIEEAIFDPLRSTCVRTPNSTWLEMTPVLGTRPKANVTVRDQVKLVGTTVYDAEYSIDDQHRRITPVEDEEARPFAAVFLGCSVTFGLGVAQDETLPAQFGVYAPEFVPQNNACSGWGPQHMWLLLQNERFIETFPRQEGIVVFAFIDDHLNRVIGNSPDRSPWRRNLPWLEIEDDHLVSRGLFSDQEPVPAGLQRYFLRLRTTQYVLARLLPDKMTEDEKTQAQTLTMRIIKESAERLRVLCPSMRFCLLVYPGSMEGSPLLSWLCGFGINCFDYSGRFLDNPDESPERLFLRDGREGQLGHPTARLHQLVAQQFAKDVHERFPELSTKETGPDKVQKENLHTRKSTNETPAITQ